MFGQNGAVVIIGSKLSRGMTPISAAHLFSKTITRHRKFIIKYKYKYKYKCKYKGKCQEVLACYPISRLRIVRANIEPNPGGRHLNGSRHKN